MAGAGWLEGRCVADDEQGAVLVGFEAPGLPSTHEADDSDIGEEFQDANIFAAGWESISERDSVFFDNNSKHQQARLIMRAPINDAGTSNAGFAPAEDSSNAAMRALDNCNEGYAKIYRDYFKPINDLTASMKTPVGPDGSSRDAAELVAPEDCAQKYFESFGSFDGSQREWADLTPLGMPFVFCHRPLYFEDANLERCGYSSCCCQPLISGAYFFGTIPILPYKMALECPCECVRSKGRCPEGCRYSCCENYLPPFDLCASTVQAAAVTGLIFIIP